MSFTPTIICDYNELRASIDEICETKCYVEEIACILEAIESDPIRFKGRDLCIFTPDFTSLNANVRELLTVHCVDYSYGLT